MAYDKVIDSAVLDGNLTSIANAIREKAELTENFAFPQGFIDAIAGISSGGGKLVTGSITLAEAHTSDIDLPLTALDFKPSIAGMIQIATPTTLQLSEVGCSIVVNSLPRSMSFGLIQLTPSIRYYGAFEDEDITLTSTGILYRNGELYYSPGPKAHNLLGTYFFFAIE